MFGSTLTGATQTGSTVKFEAVTSQGNANDRFLFLIIVVVVVSSLI